MTHFLVKAYNKFWIVVNITSYSVKVNFDLLFTPLETFFFLQDYADTEMLLSRVNVDQKALLSYAREAADFSTNQQLPTLDFAINHYGQPDVAMFDFTCMYASENAALVRQRHGHKLLVALVGDSLLEVGRMFLFENRKDMWISHVFFFYMCFTCDSMSSHGFLQVIPCVSNGNSNVPKTHIAHVNFVCLVCKGCLSS